jgi:hypothetical protein
MTAKCTFLLFDEHRRFYGVTHISKFPFCWATVYVGRKTISDFKATVARLAQLICTNNLVDFKVASDCHCDSVFMCPVELLKRAAMFDTILLLEPGLRGTLGLTVDLYTASDSPLVSAYNTCNTESRGHLGLILDNKTDVVLSDNVV